MRSGGLSWPCPYALVNGRGYPLLFMNRYGDGIIYVLAIPDNFNDLYRLPADVLSAIKQYIMPPFPVRIESPGKVALFAYDNNTFIVESYLGTEAPVRIFVSQYNVKLRNIITGDVLTGMLGTTLDQRGGKGRHDVPFTTFKVSVPPHSYLVFSVE